MQAMADDVLPPQIWAAAGGNGFAPLRIDKALLERSKSKRRPKLIRSLPEAKIIARRAMEVGYLGVLQARHEPPEQIAKDFGNLETLAGNAVSALNKLIKHLEPRSADARDLARPILTAQAGLQEGSAQELHLQAEKDAGILWAARETSHRLKGAASRKEARVRKGRQNPGKPDHAAFLQPLAEAWVYVTGSKPGSNPDPLMNPFLRFSMLAWKDIFDPNGAPDFIGALRQLPEWSENRIRLLTSIGPFWL
jgi:hypothetical protein